MKMKSGGSLAGYSFYYPNPNCRRQVYFKEALGLRSVTPSPAPLRGTIIHTAIGEYYKEGLSKTVLFSTYAKEMDKHKDYFDSDKYADFVFDGEAMIGLWYDQWHDIDSYYNFLCIEGDLTCTFEYKGQEYLYTIRPDLIYEEKDTGIQYIKDLKCTWSSLGRTYTTADNSDQATFYMEGCKGHGYNPQGFIIDGLYKKGSKILSQRFDPIFRTKSETQMALGALARKIDSMNTMMEDYEAGCDTDYTFPREGGYSCSFTCDYQGICRNNISSEYTPHGFYKEDKE